MRYEHFLFTRNQRRDFTAFVRPVDTSNKDVSAIARAFNYVNDVTPLTSEAPGLYCFPLGSYLYLLRHYDSGRRHSGREIAVIEGIAVRRAHEAELREQLPELVARQAELLNIVAQAGDVETLEVSRSAEHVWQGETADEPDDATPENSATSVDDAPTHDPADGLLEDFIRRYPSDWLALPATDDSRAFLLAALSDERLPLLHFAFGANADVTAELARTGVAFDLAAYFNISESAFRPRVAVKAISRMGESIAVQPPDEPTSEPVLQPITPQAQSAPAASPALTPTDAAGEPIHKYRRRRRARRRRGVLGALVDLLLGRSR